MDLFCFVHIKLSLVVYFLCRSLKDMLRDELRSPMANFSKKGVGEVFSGKILFSQDDTRLLDLGKCLHELREMGI